MIEITCVLGVCAPERLKTVVAVGLAVRADAVHKMPYPGDAADLATSLEPQLRSWIAGGVRRAVVEAAELTRPAELLAAFDLVKADHPGEIRLRGLITSVDAAHLAADLADHSYVAVESPESLGAEPLEARAQIVVDQIEFADALVVSAAQRPESRPVEPLLHTLAPDAQVLPLQRGRPSRLPLDRGAEHDASGWMRLLSRPPATPGEDLAPDALGAFVYSHVRPFQPDRLLALLHGSIDHGVFGDVVRSAGFCRFSTRAERPAHWSQVGHVISFDPLPPDTDAGVDGELLAIGQEIAFIGYGLKARSLTNALDSCTLTDDEFAAGAAVWRSYPDPLPKWVLEDDQSER